MAKREANLVERRAAETLGQRVRRRRREIGLTQAQLAHRANINQGFLSEIERGGRNPSGNTVNALAVALEMPSAVLLGLGADHDAPQPYEARELPLLGSIPAGPPSESQEQLVLFPVLMHLWAPDRYCLKLSFDSMEPTLKPGDIILVHYRPHVDGCPTLKRLSVGVQNGERVVILRGDNPLIAPQVIDASHELDIQGVAVALVSRSL